MEVTNYVILANLLLATLLTRTCFANPAPQSFYDDRSDNYEAYGKPLTNNRLSRLQRGYYFVDDGFITSVSASAAFPNSATAYYRPVVRYKHELTKHKKLFVPNLFG